MERLISRLEPRYTKVCKSRNCNTIFRTNHNRVAYCSKECSSEEHNIQCKERSKERTRILHTVSKPNRVVLPKPTIHKNTDIILIEYKGGVTAKAIMNRLGIKLEYKPRKIHRVDGKRMNYKVAICKLKHIEQCVEHYNNLYVETINSNYKYSLMLLKRLWNDVNEQGV